LAYLAAGTEGVEVSSGQSWQRETQERLEPRSEETWNVEFAGSAAETELLQSLEKRGVKAGRHVANDYSGRPVVSIVGPIQPPTGNY
jgi:hypothetical protein